MELNNNTLEFWLAHAPDDSFYLGRKIDYYSYYTTLKDYLHREVHKWVTIGANLTDPSIVLNDHGPDHIVSVIDRASHLVSCGDCALNALEIYLLLVSIQLHDVGNILGRYEHELNVETIMLEAEKLCGRDQIERNIVRKIVQAHGGKIRGIQNEQDKIGLLLKPEEPIMNEVVRLQAIASILRFADELADDKSRANTFSLKRGDIPKKSQVFHAYSACLDSVLIKHKHKAVELYFKIPKDLLTQKIGKFDEEIYLLDEIYNRVLKMHLERLYCMRFCKKLIDIEKIYVSIVFYDSYIDDVFPQINFEISDSGYPTASAEGIYGLCHCLNDDAGSRIDGEYVRRKIIGV
jgi:hypothetical protein